jgi:cell division protein FtsX
MDWANQKFVVASTKQQPSRVIIRTKDPGAPALSKYLKKEGLVTDADKTRFSKYRQIVDFVVNISGITGLLMLAFALLIFSLFIQLTIASCKEEIALLILLGNAPRSLGKFLMKRFFVSNIWIVLTGILIISVAQYGLYGWLADQQVNISPLISSYTLGAAVLLLLGIAWMNYSTIQKYIRLQQATK